MTDRVNPSHYHGFEAGKVETIDMIRYNGIHDLIGRRYQGDDRHRFAGLTFREQLFVGFCLGNVLKYRDRAGYKGSDPEAAAAIDEGKAVWYERMADHVVRGTLDPRTDRIGWQPPMIAERP